MERNNVGVFRKIIEVLCPSEIPARALVGNVTRQRYDVHFIGLGYVGYGSADFSEADYAYRFAGKLGKRLFPKQSRGNLTIRRFLPRPNAGQRLRQAPK